MTVLCIYKIYAVEVHFFSFLFTWRVRLYHLSGIVFAKNVNLTEIEKKRKKKNEKKLKTLIKKMYEKAAQCKL